MKIYRSCEIRATAAVGAESLVLEGRPIVYDHPTTINSPAGSFIEVIRAGALDGADMSDVRLLYNHNADKIPLARTPNTMQLTVDPAGLRMVATLPDTEEGKSAYTAVQRGDLSGMSFAFKVPQGGDNYDPATNTREILHIEKLYEVSIVPFPAYLETSVEARAAMEAAYTQVRNAAIIKANQIMMKEV